MSKNTVLSGAFALAFLVSPCAEARRYKQYIDVSHAEEILSGIHFSEPLGKTQWLGMLGGKKDQTYVVQPGDTLWDISSRAVGDPKLWRKLWQVNPDLSNPHELTVGQILSYYRESAEQAKLEIPLVKLVPNRPGAASDLDSDSLINLEIKNQYRPAFYVITEDEILGEVTGAYTEKEWLADQDELFVRLDNGETIPPKTRFSVVKIEKRIEDSTTAGRPFLGMLVRLLGEIEIIQGTDQLSKAELIRHFGIVERGSKLIALRPPLRPVAIFNPPEDLKTRIVMGEQPETKYYAQGQVVLLNKGEIDGMKEGYLFRVMRDTDPHTDSVMDVNVDFKGEVQVISIGQLSSVGLILRNKIPLLIGDTLVAAQLFKDPPPPPRVEVKEIEID